MRHWEERKQEWIRSRNKCARFEWPKHLDADLSIWSDRSEMKIEEKILTTRHKLYCSEVQRSIQTDLSFVGHVIYHCIWFFSPSHSSIEYRKSRKTKIYPFHLISKISYYMGSPVFVKCNWIRWPFFCTPVPRCSALFQFWSFPSLIPLDKLTDSQLCCT